MNSMDVERTVGDPVWFFTGDHKGEMTEGLVIAVVPHGSQTIYVIEVSTHIDPIYYAREPHQVSDAADQPIGLWRFVRKAFSDRF